MDGNRFDDLARRFGSRLTRRDAVRGLVGGAVAVVAGTTLAASEADARCGGGGVRCNRDAACCSGTCAWSTITRGRRKVRVGACTPVSCLATATACTADQECCSGICYHGLCEAACKEFVISGPVINVGCDSNADCCSNVCGQDGFCKEPEGHPCYQDSNCQTDICSGGYCVNSD